MLITKKIIRAHIRYYYFAHMAKEKICLRVDKTAFRLIQYPKHRKIETTFSLQSLIWFQAHFFAAL